MMEGFSLVTVFATGIVLAPPWRAFTGAQFTLSLVASLHSVLDNPILNSIHELASWYCWNRITPLPCICIWHHLLYSSSLSVLLMYDGFLLNRESEFSRPELIYAFLLFFLDVANTVHISIFRFLKDVTRIKMLKKFLPTELCEPIGLWPFSKNKAWSQVYQLVVRQFPSRSIFMRLSTFVKKVWDFWGWGISKTI